MSSDPSEAVAMIIMQYINESQESQLDYSQVKDKVIGDFAIESLEIFEMLLAIEEEIKKEIPDTIISGQKQISQLVDEIIKLK